ncbi:MAG: restriction endonuclease subunit S [Mucispirillum sp.]|nr:restriction endonuclease subunit S [Mucispirillum sp.]
MKSERYSYSEILDDVTRYFTKIQTNEYLETGLFPIIDQGKEFITGYTNSSLGIYNDYPIIIFGDHTRIFKYIDFPCYLGADGVKALKNIKPDKINSKYLYYYLKNSYIPDTGYNRHFKWVKELFFNVHDIQTQKEIVAVLDKVTSLISMRKEQLEKLDILVKSKFIEMFGDPVLNPKGWEKKKWNDIFNTTTGKRNSNEMVEFGQYPFFTCAKQIYYIDKYSFDCEALLLAGNNATADYDVKYYYGKFDAYQRTYVLTLKQNNSYKFFQYLLESKLSMMKNLSIGINTKYLTLKILNSIDFIIPPLDLQNQFAEFVEQVEKNKEKIKSSLNQLETLYSALMQEYFG